MLRPTIPSSTRKTRIVCISDTHGASPEDGAFKLPKGDVLIHAGDLTNQGSYNELRNTLQWIEKADFEVKIVVAGTHDITLDKDFYTENGLYFHNQHPQDPGQCMALMQTSSVVYLHHSSATIRLGSPSGPHTIFRVFGSPYVPARGNWAFGYNHHSDQAASLWDQIPLDTDIVITHTPAYNHCDASPRWGAAGCEKLRKALWRVRPRLALCGHVHEGRGVERVQWRLDLPQTPFLERPAELWKDPGAGTKKMSFVDLTTKGGRPLDNDGACAGQTFENRVTFSRALTEDDEEEFAMSYYEGSSVFSLGTETVTTALSKPSVQQAASRKATVSGQELPASTSQQQSRLHQDHIRTLSGRMGRKETCVVNAAIMAKSWGNRPKRFNKPIVVDLDLPVWDSHVVVPESVRASPASSSMAVQPSQLSRLVGGPYAIPTSYADSIGLRSGSETVASDESVYERNFSSP